MQPVENITSVLLVAFLFASSAFCASENLVGNGGFEVAGDRLPEGWSVSIDGDWTGDGKTLVHSREIVGFSPDALTGKQALVIDTTALNPGGKIIDELRTWKNPKYEIYVTQDVHGVKPNSWYLVTFRIKSPQILVDVGLQLLTDMKPWPHPIVRRESFGKTHWGNYTVEGRVTLAHAPKPDGEYHEYVKLQQTLEQTDTLRVGVRIRAPWTGKILIDDVEVREIDPDREMTRMKKFLAMRAAKPIKKVRRLNRETMLVDDGLASAAILIPDDDFYRELGEKVRKRVKDLTATTLPLATRLADIPGGQNIVALGNMMHNDLVARLHFNRYVKVDALSPGPGGYVIWSVCEPYGLAKKQNVIVVAGSDAASEAAAVGAFCEMLPVEGKTIKLPFLHTVFPKRKLTQNEKQVPRRRYGYGGHYSGFSKWALDKWLDTGDPEAATLARNELFRSIEHYLSNPYAHDMWAGFWVGLSWDTLEEAPVFSDEDRLKITNWLLGYLHIRPKITSDWWFMVPHLNKNAPTWNHQAKGLAGMYTMGRYFKRFYGEEDARFDLYLGAAGNVFQQQRQWWKPEENSENYTSLTMRDALAYYLGEWDMTFFENDSMCRYATHFATVCNNKGWCSGYGDAYYCYTGWRGGKHGFGAFEVPLGLWYYKDGRFLWWSEHVNPKYRSPYHQDVEPVEWSELVGVKKTPLERGIYDPNSRLELWGSDGEGAEQPVGDIRYEETFDKISFRENWEPDGQYMLLEGLGRGIHSGRATNQICKLSILGEDLLIGSTYRGNHVRSNCSVIVVKDKHINDPSVRGGPGAYSIEDQSKWMPLFYAYPAYAGLDTMADLPNSGFTRTSMRDFLGGTDWHRNIFWLKGRYFALIDEVVAKKPGTYYVESNLRTSPKTDGSWTRGIIPREGRILPDNRGYEVSIETPRRTRHYILTDGAADITTDKAPANALSTVMVRQVHEGRKLDPGERVTYINLLYGDTEPDRANYRVERLSETEGLVFQGTRPIAYFGTGQCEKTKAVLPIEAKMFMLTGEMLAVVDATSAGDLFKSERPASREVYVPGQKVVEILKALGN